MKVLKVVRPLAALVLVFALGVSALADTIRMKDGQVIRGQIVAFRDQQFTVLIGSPGAAAAAAASRLTWRTSSPSSSTRPRAHRPLRRTTAATRIPRSRPAARRRPRPVRPTRPASSDRHAPAHPRQRFGHGFQHRQHAALEHRLDPEQHADARARRRIAFFPVRVRVSATNTANGWTDSGLMVRKGQRLRISATGRISLGEGRFSTPTGLPRVVDTEKLMRNKPTGTLIVVIGDDNDEFIAVGANREFYAPRDGRLFLGVNEGRLEDNTGSYDALIEVEPVASGGR